MTDTPNLTAALAAVQAVLPPIAKGETAEVEGKSKTGVPYKYKYSYADLADVSAVILPLLGKHGLAWVTKPTFNPAGKFVLVYKLRHVSGEEEVGEYPLSVGTPQEIGSAITYARRYALCAVTGVAPASDDDDGAAATRQAQRSDWDDSRPARPAQPDPEAARMNILANARKAMGAATEQDALDAIGRRLSEYEQAGKITGQDAVVARRLLVARIDELFPAGEQAAVEPSGAEQSDLGGDWPAATRPGNPT